MFVLIASWVAAGFALELLRYSHPLRYAVVAPNENGAQEMRMAKLKYFPWLVDVAS